jgi:hypothetical protein
MGSGRGEAGSNEQSCQAAFPMGSARDGSCGSITGKCRSAVGRSIVPTSHIRLRHRSESRVREHVHNTCPSLLAEVADSKTSIGLVKHVDHAFASA